MLKRRITAVFLTLCLCCSLCVTGAGAVNTDRAVEATRTLGILPKGAELNSRVTRAQLAVMLTAASTYRDSIGTGGGSSLYKDVKKDHWAGEYIKLAVRQGWMSGYVDGTFRPEQNVTLEEACASLLIVLGYDASSLAGSYPYAQLAKAASVGLRDDLSAGQGQALTVQDCAVLFYNLLVSQNSSGTVYGTTLGYTVTNGQIDYSTLVNSDTKGPYVAERNGAVTVPFGTGNAVVYRDGVQSTLSAIQKYDVYYYNANMETIWAYNKRISGTLTAVSPNTAAPTSVTVAGTSYSLGTSDAVYKCSSQGSFPVGSLVTLLLDKDGAVADVVSVSEAEGIYYGVVTSSKKAASTSTTSSTTASAHSQSEVACTDGVSRTFYTNAGPYTVGRVVSVTVNSSGTTIKNIQPERLSGKVSRDGATLAGYRFAENVEILDTDSEGGYARIYLSRLANAQLKDENVLGYTLDQEGRIDRLFLRNATGDTYKYVYITSAEKQSEGMNHSSSYSYLQNGQSRSYQSSTAVYLADVGGARLVYDGDMLKSIKQLNSVKLSSLGSLDAMGDGKKYLLDENVQVILRSGGYYPTTLSEINGEDYKLTGWYDALNCPAGGRIRMIIAEPNAS